MLGVPQSVVRRDWLELCRLSSVAVEDAALHKGQEYKNLGQTLAANGKQSLKGMRLLTKSSRVLQGAGHSLWLHIAGDNNIILKSLTYIRFLLYVPSQCCQPSLRLPHKYLFNDAPPIYMVSSSQDP